MSILELITLVTNRIDHLGQQLVSATQRGDLPVVAEIEQGIADARSVIDKLTMLV